MSKYIDEAGVQQLWEKTKEQIEQEAATSLKGIESRGSSSGTSFTVSIPSITSLEAGVGFLMIPHTTNPGNSPVAIMVNKVGYSTVRLYGSNSSILDAGVIQAGVPIFVTYDGTCWRIKDPRVSTDSLPTETWKFTLADGSVVEKKVVVLP